MARFDKDRVEVAFDDERKATWKFRGRTISGHECEYDVIDRNFVSRHQWRFLVRIPKKSSTEYWGVSPNRVPNRLFWAGLDRRSVQFSRGTIGRHRSRLYARLSVSDPTGEKTRRVLGESDRDDLPRGLRQFRPISIHRVTRSKRKGDRDLVVSVRNEDHATMIKLFIAAKAWTLAEQYKIAAQPTSRSVTRKPKGYLRGLKVAVSGWLASGFRRHFFRRLTQAGAIPKSTITTDTDILVVGSHFLGKDRNKLKFAKDHGIPQWTEAKFLQRYWK